MYCEGQSCGFEVITVPLEVDSGLWKVSRVAVPHK